MIEKRMIIKEFKVVVTDVIQEAHDTATFVLLTGNDVLA